MSPRGKPIWSACALVSRDLRCAWVASAPISPAILVFMVCMRYSHLLPTITGLLSLALLGYAYVELVSGKITRTPQTSIRYILGWFLRAAVYPDLAVGCAVRTAARLFLAMVYAACELLFRRWYGISLFCLLLMAVLSCIVGLSIFRVSMTNTCWETLCLSWYIHNWPTQEKMITPGYTVCLFAVTIALARGLWQIFAGGLSADRTVAEATQAGKASQVQTVEPITSPLARLSDWISTSIARWKVESPLFLTLPFASLTGEEKTPLEIHCCAHHWMWHISTSRHPWLSRQLRQNGRGCLRFVLCQPIQVAHGFVSAAFKPSAVNEQTSAACYNAGASSTRCQSGLCERQPTFARQISPSTVGSHGIVDRLPGG